MSMTSLMILQFTGMLLAYSGITLLLPALMFRRILQGRKVAEQFLMCYTSGNFYIINIVFLLQLLHISNAITLIVTTLVLSIVIWSRVEKVSLRKKFKLLAKSNRKVIQGKMGWRSVRVRIFQNIKEKCRYMGGYLYRGMVCKPVQWLFFALLLLVLIWVYGRKIVLAYGYSASDIPVHMDWINQMSRGSLFARGVYPFGFHCMVYYLHTVFRFETFAVLCQFFFVQVIYAHLVLLALLKLFCRSRYLPYAGVILYAAGNFWAQQTFSRYYAMLPQEFGMIFVIPSIYFLARFFQTKKENLKTKENFYQAGCFAMAFSLTLAIHFYGTMIAGICCVAIALGFFFRFLRWRYFKKIMLTGIISVFIAVLPMGIAFATGTPLQGSLGWGLSVISGGQSGNDDSSDEEETSSAETDSQADEASQDSDTSQNESGDQSTSADSSTVNPAPSAEGTGGTVISESAQQNPEAENAAAVKEQSKTELMMEKVKTAITVAEERISEYILPVENVNTGRYVLLAIAALFPMGLLFCIFRKCEYGALLWSCALSLGFLILLLCAGPFGLPVLMDPARCSIYLAYLLMIVPVMLADSILYLIFMHRVLIIPRNVLSCVFSVAAIGCLFQNGLIKEPQFKSDFVSNGAITCLYNIIHDNEDSTWTIISANDETQMGLDHGWHMESISLLREIEYLKPDSQKTIPTKEIYVFIEKIPSNYTLVYPGSGQSISKKGAAQALPNQGGIGCYEGEARWIVMSRLYSWAQAFMEQYPNEMQVYYESEDFICYRIEQNMYHLYNLAIDYGYNTVLSETDGDGMQ